MWMLELLWLLLVPFISGWVSVYLMSWGIRRALRNMGHDLAVVEDRLLRETKRRVAEERWSKDPAAPPADVDAAIAEIRKLAIGETDAKGWMQGKGGGVQRGPI